MLPKKQSIKEETALPDENTTDEGISMPSTDIMDNGNKQINSTAGNDIVTVRLWYSSPSTVEMSVLVSKPADFNILSTVLPITISALVLIVVVVLFIYYQTLVNLYCYKCHKKQREYRLGSPVTETHRFDILEMDSL